MVSVSFAAYCTSMTYIWDVLNVCANIYATLSLVPETFLFFFFVVQAMKEVRSCMENPFDDVLKPLRGKALN